MGYAAAPGVAFIVSGIEAFFTAIIIKRERINRYKDLKHEALIRMYNKVHVITAIIGALETIHRNM